MPAVARLTILSIIIVTAQCNSNNEIHSMSQIKKKEAAFKACIDDSDCVDQGSDYACFQYICYPWEDDSAVPKNDKRATCKSQDQCSAGLECFRHHDRRNIHKGLCMEPIADCSENGDSDCKHGKGYYHVSCMTVILFIIIFIQLTTYVVQCSVSKINRYLFSSPF